jgi:hypothetical protein
MLTVSGNSCNTWNYEHVIYLFIYSFIYILQILIRLQNTTVYRISQCSVDIGLQEAYI